MESKHIIRQGESLQSIAFSLGFSPETIWDDPNNQALRETRPNPDALLPGDSLYIPSPAQKHVAAMTDQRHVFRRRGVPAHLDIRLCNQDGTPIVDVPCILRVDGVAREIVTDDDGFLRTTVSPGAKQATLVVDVDGDELVLAIGHLDPSVEISGAQGRLRNLGLYSGAIHGELDAATREALIVFQRRQSLEESAVLDAQTALALRDLHETR